MKRRKIKLFSKVTFSIFQAPFLYGPLYIPFNTHEKLYWMRTKKKPKRKKEIHIIEFKMSIFSWSNTGGSEEMLYQTEHQIFFYMKKNEIFKKIRKVTVK